jgi:hypothetical protein
MIKEIYDLVTRIDQSKILKDLGVDQKSLFKWMQNEHGTFDILINDKLYGENGYAAFTSQELGEILIKHGFSHYLITPYDEIKMEAFKRAKYLIDLLQKDK